MTSERDQLGIALNDMTDYLSRADDIQKREQWMQAGTARLAEKMRGEQDMAALGTKIITQLAHHLEAQVGVFYTAGDAGELQLTGSYAYTRRKHLSNVFKPGEGVVGQAPLERQMILLSEVPEDYMAVTSGLGETVPRNLLVMPIESDDAVVAVIELGALDAFSDLQVKFLASVTEGIGIAVGTVRSHERVEALLEESQRQAETLQNQQEELKAANEELEEKSERLLQSERSLQGQSASLRQSNAELEEKTESLQRQKADIEDKNRLIELGRQDLEEKASQLELTSKYKSEFLANMSHELRTPLNSLLILANSLAQNEEGNLTDDQKKSAEIIHHGGMELLTLVNDVLDLSKVEAGKMEVLVEAMLFEELLEQTRQQFLPLAEEKGLAFDLELQPGIPDALHTDPQKCRQVLKNLLSNAFKFTEKGTVSLRVHAPAADTRFTREGLDHANTLALSVSDTRIGVSDDQQRHIFEAFQQADGTTSRTYGGTGLGLSISRELATLLGGELQLRSQEGTGSTFTLYLPKQPRTYTEATPSAGERQAPPRRLAWQVGGENSGVGPTGSELSEREFLPDDRREIGSQDRSLLIIEDDTRFARKVMKLARDSGFKCLVANDGKSGLDLACRHLPTAIVLDLGLPDISGMQVLDTLSANEATRAIPVHVISGRNARGEAIDRGAAGYLEKPVDAKTICNVLAGFEPPANGEPSQMPGLSERSEARSRDCESGWKRQVGGHHRGQYGGVGRQARIGQLRWRNPGLRRGQYRRPRPGRGPLQRSGARKTVDRPCASTSSPPGKNSASSGAMRAA